MSYATLPLLIERFGERQLVELTDRDSPRTGAIVVSVVTRAIADTDAVIDGHVGVLYALPLAEVPPLLIDLALAIAFYKLHRFSPEGKVEQDYRDAMASLDRIAKGTIKLPIAGVEPEGSGAAGVETIDRERDFTPENMRGFI